MNRLVAAATAIFMLAPGFAHAAPLLSEQQARAKAIDILKGDPYGNSPAEIAKIIKQAQLVRDGPTKACSNRKGPAWEFHVVVVTANKDQFNNGVIDGYLAQCQNPVHEFADAGLAATLTVYAKSRPNQLVVREECF